MCGRFTQQLPWPELVRLYRLTMDYELHKNAEPRYNIAPTQIVPFVTKGDEGNHRLREGRWWLAPWWAKEMPKQAMFNARSETADTTGAFKDAFKSKRCLIPADGFYEWTKSADDGGRDPWYIHLPEHQPFAFAGLWAHNTKLDVTSCTILTAPAAEPITQLHDRQPIILQSGGVRRVARSRHVGVRGQGIAQSRPRWRTAVLPRRAGRQFVSHQGQAAERESEADRAALRMASVPTERKMPKLIVVAAFDRDEHGELQAVFAPAEQISEARAIRTAKSLATKHAGVVAWSREANPTLGEYGPPTILFQAGSVPDMA